MECGDEGHRLVGIDRERERKREREKERKREREREIEGERARERMGGTCLIEELDRSRRR
jgi:hypothetical protein